MKPKGCVNQGQTTLIVEWDNKPKAYPEVWVWTIERVDARSSFQIIMGKWFYGIFLCIEMTHDFENNIQPFSQKFDQINKFVTQLENAQ